MSEAAVDVDNARADFSQANKDVEIAGPGVGVLSTVPTGTGPLGIGSAVNAAAAGRVCLIARGTVDFATQVSNCQASGGVGAANHAYFDGTSMATPHVSAVAALVWSYFTPQAPTAGRTCTATQLRTSLNRSARDLGTAGRDNSFGFGLVQARAAYDRIVSLGCGN